MCTLGVTVSLMVCVLLRVLSNCMSVAMANLAAIVKALRAVNFASTIGIRRIKDIDWAPCFEAVSRAALLPGSILSVLLQAQAPLRYPPVGVMGAWATAVGMAAEAVVLVEMLRPVPKDIEALCPLRGHRILLTKDASTTGPAHTSPAPGTCSPLASNLKVAVASCEPCVSFKLL